MIMHNKLKSYLLSAVILISGTVILYGCGSGATRGGGGGGSNNPNLGTITGHVYIYDGTNELMIGTADAIVSVSTEAMSLEVSVTTGASGAFTLSGLPSGILTITATKEGITPILSVVANSNKVDLVIGGFGSYPVGTATIRGTIEGAPFSGGVSPIFQVKPYLYNGKFYDFFGTADATTGTYEITGAPDAGLTYVRAVYVDSSAFVYYQAYAKVSPAPSSLTYLDIPHQDGITMDVHLLNKPSNHTVTGIRVYLSNGYARLNSLNGVEPTTDASSDYKIENQLPLQSGDSYMIEVRLSDEAGLKSRKAFFGCTGANQSLDVMLPIEQSTFLKFPAGGTSFSDISTLEVEGVSGASYYVVMIKDPSDYIWYIYSETTKISLPKNIRSKLSGAYAVVVYAYKGHNTPAVYEMNHVLSFPNDDYKVPMEYFIGSKTILINY